MSLLGDNHVYSYSQLSSFDECRYGFYLRRIEGMEEPTSNAFAERGTLIHDLLDKWAKKILTKPEMIKEYEQRYSDEVVSSWPRVLSSKGYAMKAYEKGIQFLEAFDEFEGYEVLSAEEKFKIDLPLTNGETRPFIGIVDMMLREKSSGDLIICDHKSKSLQSFKKDQDEMYRQQLLYTAYVKEKYGQYPQQLMFHLFNEDGVKPARLFSEDQYIEALEWATKQILGIEKCSVIDWLVCKEKPDYFCWNLCDARKQCPNGVQPDFRSKKKNDEYEGFKDEGDLF